MGRSPTKALLGLRLKINIAIGSESGASKAAVVFQRRFMSQKNLEKANIQRGVGPKSRSEEALHGRGGVKCRSYGSKVQGGGRTSKEAEVAGKWNDASK